MSDLRKQLAEAFHAGVLQERRRLSERYADIEVAWRRFGRRSWAQRIADEIAAMEVLAAKNRAATWRGRYPGGPVDWETGKLVQQAVRSTP